MSIQDENHKWIYLYGNGHAEGNKDMRDLLGGKGVGLHDMTSIGLPVPPGFTITTEVCRYYYDHKKNYPKSLLDEIQNGIRHIEEIVNKKFGDENNPLLVAVRSGAPVSMPGMMDTVLNLGLNDKTVKGLEKKTGNKTFAYDSYRRFIKMYGDIVMGISYKEFEKVLNNVKKDKNVKSDNELKDDGLEKVIEGYKALIREKRGIEFPQNVQEQLKQAIHAVFCSWNNPRAITYRNINGIPHTMGTAVNIVSMVFGNMGNTSATGVTFTRSPSTGEKVFYGEYLVNAQGEDVVSGVSTPQQISKAGKEAVHSKKPSMEEKFPEMYEQLKDVREKLERHNKDMQDIEFTIQEGKLYLLQQRNGKRTAKAAVKIAVDLVKEKIITKDEAICSVDPISLNQLLGRQIDPNAKKTIIAKGLNASPGVAIGTIVFTAEDAQIKCRYGPVILIREETRPDDISGMHVAKGILTKKGGMTSHAAVVARSMGTPAITGCGETMVINFENKTVSFGGKEYKEGDWLSFSGDNGEVYDGKVDTIEPQIIGDFETIMKWADETRRLKVEADVETTKDAQRARDFGAQGIGLFRTEHMFFDPKRIVSIRNIRKMILAETDEQKQEAIATIKESLSNQISEFEDLFRIMDGKPVTIRLLDFHEFLPKTDKEIKELAKEINVDEEHIRETVGNRGYRFGISIPEITKMQGRAILTAAMNVTKAGVKAIPQVMIPLAATKKELEIYKGILTEVEENNVTFPYEFGTMIALPRACFKSGELASLADFFSFDISDLTQTTLGISRNNFKYVKDFYQENEIFDTDPFDALDEEDVGELIKTSITKGKKVRNDLRTGICGEHGANPKSIQFADAVGIDYVSCSPLKIPIARLAAAQAAIKNKKNKK